MRVQAIKEFGKRLIQKWTTKEGFIGDYDYKYLFLPEIPLKRKLVKKQPFFGLDSNMPLLLGFILGFQHALAMLAGVVTPPMLMAAAANLDMSTEQYLVSASLIVSGIMSFIQITRFRIYKTPYFMGTGVLTVVGTSFSAISIVTKALPMMYRTGVCPVIDGVEQSCPDGYGKILGTAMVCSLLEILLSFIPSKQLQKIFPPIVTGPVVLLIGVSLIESSFKDWMGGSNCVGKLCGEVHPLQWGSAEFVGLGFLVYVTIIIAERFGPPIMKSCAVIIGLLVGCIVAAACGYFSRKGIDSAPAVTFVWVHTFKLGIYGPAILPFLALNIVLMMEAIGDITATSDVSKLEVEGKLYESRIQGGILADGFNGILSGLMTLTPMSVFVQNNGVISITKCANRRAGYWCVFFLIIMGIFSKFAASIVAIPKAVLGAMTSFLFSSVAVSGIRIISTIEFTRRDRFVLIASLLPGFGSVLVPNWFEKVFSYSKDNDTLLGFFDAIVLVMETGFAVTGFLGLILNLILPEMKDEPKIFDKVVFQLSESKQDSSDNNYKQKKIFSVENV